MEAIFQGNSISDQGRYTVQSGNSHRQEGVLSSASPVRQLKISRCSEDTSVKVTDLNQRLTVTACFWCLGLLVHQRSPISMLKKLHSFLHRWARQRPFTTGSTRMGQRGAQQPQSQLSRQRGPQTRSWQKQVWLFVGILPQGAQCTSTYTPLFAVHVFRGPSPDGTR